MYGCSHIKDSTPESKPLLGGAESSVGVVECVGVLVETVEGNDGGRSRVSIVAESQPGELVIGGGESGLSGGGSSTNCGVHVSFSVGGHVEGVDGSGVVSGDVDLDLGSGQSDVSLLVSVVNDSLDGSRVCRLVLGVKERVIELSDVEEVREGSDTRNGDRLGTLVSPSSDILSVLSVTAASETGSNNTRDSGVDVEGGPEIEVEVSRLVLKGDHELSVASAGESWEERHVEEVGRGEEVDVILVNVESGGGGSDGVGSVVDGVEDGGSVSSDEGADLGSGGSSVVDDALEEGDGGLRVRDDFSGDGVLNVDDDVSFVERSLDGLSVRDGVVSLGEETGSCGRIGGIVVVSVHGDETNVDVVDLLVSSDENVSGECFEIISGNFDDDSVGSPVLEDGGNGDLEVSGGRSLGRESLIGGGGRSFSGSVNLDGEDLTSSRLSDVEVAGLTLRESGVNSDVTSDVDGDSGGEDIDGDGLGGREGSTVSEGIIEVNGVGAVHNIGGGGGGLEEGVRAEVEGGEESVDLLGSSFEGEVSSVGGTLNGVSNTVGITSGGGESLDVGVGGGRVELEGSHSGEGDSVSEVLALVSGEGTVLRKGFDSLDGDAAEVHEHVGGEGGFEVSRGGNNVNSGDHGVLSGGGEGNPPDHDPADDNSEDRESSHGEIHSVVGSSTVSGSELNEEEGGSEGCADGDGEEESPDSELGEGVKEGVGEHVAASEVEAADSVSVGLGVLVVLVLLVLPVVDLVGLGALEGVGGGGGVGLEQVLVASHVLDEVLGEVVHVVSAVGAEDVVGVGGLSEDDSGDVEGDEGGDEEEDTVDVVSGGESSEVEEDSDEGEDGEGDGEPEEPVGDPSGDDLEDLGEVGVGVGVVAEVDDDAREEDDEEVGDSEPLSNGLLSGDADVGGED